MLGGREYFFDTDGGGPEEPDVLLFVDFEICNETVDDGLLEGDVGDVLDDHVDGGSELPWDVASS
jgi:hypothetical protein